ncbi:hypothetical protein AHF37_08076 [Paragonimus kellicotti]|nr:hypothetical protein AHF37_08076 [Paragonimus kellicotti]
MLTGTQFVRGRRSGGSHSATIHALVCPPTRSCLTPQSRLFHWWANPRGNAIRGRPVDGVEQAHSTRPDEKNTGNFIGLSLETVAEITLQRTDTTHDLSSESREAIRQASRPTRPVHQQTTR